MPNQEKLRQMKRLITISLKLDFIDEEDLVAKLCLRCGKDIREHDETLKQQVFIQSNELEDNIKKGVQVWADFLSIWSRGQITFPDSLSDEPQQMKNNRLTTVDYP